MHGTLLYREDNGMHNIEYLMYSTQWYPHFQLKRIIHASCPTEYVLLESTTKENYLKQTMLHREINNLQTI